MAAPLLGVRCAFAAFPGFILAATSVLVLPAEYVSRALMKPTRCRRVLDRDCRSQKFNINSKTSTKNSKSSIIHSKMFIKNSSKIQKTRLTFTENSNLKKIQLPLRSGLTTARLGLRRDAPACRVPVRAPGRRRRRPRWRCRAPLLRPWRQRRMAPPSSRRRGPKRGPPGAVGAHALRRLDWVVATATHRAADRRPALAPRPPSSSSSGSSPARPRPANLSPPQGPRRRGVVCRLPAKPRPARFPREVPWCVKRMKKAREVCADCAAAGAGRAGRREGRGPRRRRADGRRRHGPAHRATEVEIKC